MNDKEGAIFTNFHVWGLMAYRCRPQLLVTLGATINPPRILSFDEYFPSTQEMTTIFSDLVIKPLPHAIDLPDLFGTECTHWVLHVHVKMAKPRAKRDLDS